MTADRGISRRSLLTGRFLRRPPAAAPLPGTASGARAAARRAAFPLLRPPGAVDEPDFLARCTRCDACVEACPHEAVVRAPIRFRGAAGTPMIDPAIAPCRLCDDRPCAAACESGALRLDLAATMGTARIDEAACLAHAGTTCSTCVEHCPVDGAIAVRAGRPTVVEDACTGCGICHHVCPAPVNAVLVLPARRRPAPPIEEPS